MLLYLLILGVIVAIIGVLDGNLDTAWTGVIICSVVIGIDYLVNKKDSK